MPELRQEYLDILEKREWSVSSYTDDGRVEIEWYSPAGEDFIICVGVEKFPDEVLDYSDSFDVDEHIAMWMLSSPDAMIQRLFEWKISAKPVHLILTGTRVNFYAAIQSLQPYRKGGDPGSIYYKIKLKEYREVRIRQVKVSSTGTATVSSGSTRTDNRVQAKTYTVKPGDCLYNISKSTLGDGGRYNEIYSLNKDKLKNPNLIYPGQVLQLP